MVYINFEQQLEYLIREYQNLIYSICYQFTKDYFEAQDLAQETFLSAYRNLQNFDGANEKAWLCKIATNKCLDYQKKASRRMIPTNDTFFLTAQDPGDSPENQWLNQEIRQELFEHCQMLKSPYKEVAIDYFYNEMDMKDIAEKTDKNIKTVQTQIYRAKAMLRTHYQRKGAKQR